MAVPSVQNIGLQRVMARNAARGAAHKLVHTDTSNLKKLDPCVQETSYVDWTRPIGPAEPSQIPAEPNEPRDSACCTSFLLSPRRRAHGRNDRRPSAADAHALLSSNELGSLVVRLIKGYTTEQAVAPRPVYGIGKRWNITT